MGDFNRGNRFGGNRSFGRRDFGNRGEDRQMTKTICSTCGKDCEVPFKPTGSKPVYCSDCFEKNGGPSRRFGDRNANRPHGEFRSNPQPQNNEKLNAIEAKLDKILAILSPLAEVAPEAMNTEEVVSMPQEEKHEDMYVESKELISTPKKKKVSKKTTPSPQEEHPTTPTT